MTLCVMVMIWGSLSSAAADPSSRVSMCPRESVVDLIFGFLDRGCVGYGSVESPDFVGVTEVFGILVFIFLFLFYGFGMFSFSFLVLICI